MFGIIYIAFMVIATLFAGIAACNQNYKSKKWWSKLSKEDNPNNIYYDRRGVRRDLKSDNPIDIVHSYRTGDAIKVIGYERDNKVNLSEQWRKDHFEIAKRNIYREYSVFPDINILHNYPNDIIKREDNKWDDRWYAIGQWWKDLKTNELYCIRVIEKDDYKFDCYMNIDTGLLVRPADDHNYKRISKDICTKIINDYNIKKRQKAMPNTTLDWNMFYENSHVSYWSGYSHLVNILKEMRRDGCEPSTF